MTIGDTVVDGVLGTVLVVVLALLWLAVGAYFLWSRDGQRSRGWFGMALILGGVGAALAGVSYQAFGYVLKCQGWDYCRLTNGYEVGYNLMQALSVSAMLIAVAHACTAGTARRALIAYAWVNAAVYAAVTAVGVLAPSAVLLSFTVLMLFALPGLVLVIIISARRARSERMSRVILLVALLQVLVQVVYFAYWLADITGSLREQGIFFNENDALHVAMIAWLLYVWRALGPLLRDKPSADRADIHDS